MKVLQHLSGRERTWLALAVIVVAIVVLDRVVLIPVKNNLDAMEADIQAKKAQLVGYQHSATQKPFVVRAYSRYEPYLQRVGSDEEETSRILGTIETVARSTDVKLVDAKAREPRGEQWYKLFNVEIKAEATVQELVKFLYKLNTSEDALRVDTLQVSVGDRGSPAVRATALITKLAGTPQTARADL
ncbi:MAG: hypothetical protein K9N51_07120 [Candidatus Pacebacteria bacterium]|nr:hypothetical protein [Candidatus Paceibacterota bacterium]